MKVDVVMPKMGESLQEGTITKWLKKEGDAIERDEMILEISTDKVDTEVPAPVSGILTKIIAQENETVEVGKVIAEIETEASAADYSKGETQEEKQEPQPPSSQAKEEVPAAPSEPPIPDKQDEEKEEIEIKPEAKSVGGNLVEVVMPKMGESLQEGTITKWLKKPGDKIERDEMIFEISTDKVDTEVPSPVSGTIDEILVGENETVGVGTVVARINTGGEAAAQPAKTEEKPKAEAKPQAVKQTVQAEAPVEETSVEETPETEEGEIPREAGKKFFSPLVRNIAETEGVSLKELQQIKGSGIEGRVTKQDLLNYIETRKKAPSAQKPAPEAKPAPTPKPESATPAPQAKPQPTQVAAPVSLAAGDESVPMDRVRQLIMEHMVYSWHTSPHVTSVAEADITQIVKFREKHKAEFEKREGLKLTYMPFMAKATCDAIKQFPQINVSVDGKNIINHKNINLGIATALEGFSLIVPVIKNADALNISGLARSIYDLSNRARTKKLNPEDIQGGTFTITNFGAFNTLFGTPIINQPQVAIMGVGTIGKRPVVKEVEGEHVVVVRDMVYISLTFDHRVVDGMLAGYVLNAIVKGLESMNETNISL